MQNRRRESRAVRKAKGNKVQKKFPLLGMSSPWKKNLYARTEKRSHSWEMGDHLYREESKTL
jgi:hypothetical protein